MRRGDGEGEVGGIRRTVKVGSRIDTNEHVSEMFYDERDCARVKVERDACRMR
jgi:hypothetical protein